MEEGMDDGVGGGSSGLQLDTKAERVRRRVLSKRWSHLREWKMELAFSSRVLTRERQCSGCMEGFSAMHAGTHIRS